MAEDMFPELTDKLAFFDDWIATQRRADGAPVAAKPHLRQLGSVETRFRGAPIEVGAEPYLLYVLQRAVDTLDALDTVESPRVLDGLRRLGLERAVPTGRDYRVARENNIEVWLIARRGE